MAPVWITNSFPPETAVSAPESASSVGTAAGAGVFAGSGASVGPGAPAIAVVGWGEAAAGAGSAGVAAGLGSAGASGVAAALHPNATRGTRSNIKVKASGMAARGDRVDVEGLARCRWSISRASKHQHSGSPCHQVKRRAGRRCTGPEARVRGKFAEIVEPGRGLAGRNSPCLDRRS